MIMAKGGVVTIAVSRRRRRRRRRSVGKSTFTRITAIIIVLMSQINFASMYNRFNFFQLFRSTIRSIGRICAIRNQKRRFCFIIPRITIRARFF